MSRKQPWPDASSSASQQKKVQHLPRQPKTKKIKKERPDLFIQDEFPIRKIQNGFIETADNRLIKIVEILPQNFISMNDAEQQAVLELLHSYFKIAPQRFQIKAMSKKVDIEKHVKMVLERLKDEKNPRIHEMANSYLQKVQSIKESNARTTRFFVIITSQNMKFAEREDVESDLEMLAGTVRQKFNRCGNETLKFDSVEDEDEYLHELLYIIYNRSSSANESYKKRKQKIIDDAKAACEKYHFPYNDLNLPPSQLIAPRGIDFSHGHYFVMDGLYYCVLFVPSNGYRNIVPAAWMTILMNAGAGVNMDVDMHMSRTSKHQVLTSAGRTVRLSRISLNAQSDGSIRQEITREKFESGTIIREGLASQQELYYVNTFITITASTKRALLKMKRSMFDNLRSIDFEVNECRWVQESGWRSSLPIASVEKQLNYRSKQNMLSETVSGSYPFCSFEICDEGGILIGQNTQNSSLVIHDPFNTRLHLNGNMTIIGTSGMGKTYLLSLLAIRLRMLGIQVFIIAPVKADEFRRVCTALGGSFISIAPSSPDCINVMEIRNIDRSAEIKLSGTDILKQSLLLKKIDQINAFAALQIPDMSYEEMQIVDEAILNTYEKFGINNDNESLFADETKTKFKTMPTLGDLHNTMAEMNGGERIARIFRRYTSGSSQSFNGQTNVDLNNKLVVLNLEDLSKNLKHIGMFVALDFLWDKAKSNRTEKKAIFIDEVYQLVGSKGSEQAAAFVEDIYRLIRGYGGAAISATQDVSDILGYNEGKFAKAILTCSSTKFLMGLEETNAKLISGMIPLTEREIAQMGKAVKGEALLISSVGKVNVKIEGSRSEHSLITTDREDLQNLVDDTSR